MFAIGQIIGPYVLVRKLGRGGFGEVWLAEKRTELVTLRVAVKLPLDPNVDLKTIRNEAMLWEKASGHPNVLPIIDADIYDGQVVIASEFADGGSLDRWMKANGGKAPSVKKALEIMDGILGGLVHLHSHKITHRDLKPNNILLHRNIPRITDFGVSRIVEHSSHGTESLGTPIYMSPEAFQKSMSPKTDIWSAGVVLYELVSGYLPFHDEDVFALMDAIRMSEPRPLPEDTPNFLHEFIKRSLEKDPKVRFQTAREMRAILSKFSPDHGPDHVSEVALSSECPTDRGLDGSSLSLIESETVPLALARDRTDSVETRKQAPSVNGIPSRRLIAVGLAPLAVLAIGAAFLWLQPRAVEPVEIQSNKAENASTPDATINRQLTEAVNEQRIDDPVKTPDRTPSSSTPIVTRPKKVISYPKPVQTKTPKRKVTLEDLIKDGSKKN
ncbi:MAG: serine/threonine-protein kinase [Pyrinomonadaceae bacterium]